MLEQTPWTTNTAAAAPEAQRVFDVAEYQRISEQIPWSMDTTTAMQNMPEFSTTQMPYQIGMALIQPQCSTPTYGYCSNSYERPLELISMPLPPMPTAIPAQLDVLALASVAECGTTAPESIPSIPLRRPESLLTPRASHHRSRPLSAMSNTKSVTKKSRGTLASTRITKLGRHESSKADQHYKLQASLPLVDDRVQLHWTTTQREDARSGYTSCNSPTMLVREVRGAPRSSSFTTPASSPVPSLDSLQAHQTDLKRQRINIQRAISHMEEALKANPTGGWDFAKKKLLRMDRFKARLEEMKLSEDVARVRKEGNEGQR
ncbi:hypothetical protein LTS12_027421 [Elasticomyces elasticus]|nr:hypothetical protein LTS12_027421 [Elasticomyces elasticus]